jgi:hypothetical protein
MKLRPPTFLAAHRALRRAALKVEAPVAIPLPGPPASARRRRPLPEVPTVGVFSPAAALGPMTLPLVVLRPQPPAGGGSRPGRLGAAAAKPVVEDRW